MPKAKEPDFLIIGLQKSGTYWLTSLLNAHPDITCIPAMYGGQTGVEEGHFFDTLGSIDEDGGEKFKLVFGRAHNGFYSDLVKHFGRVNRQKLYLEFKERYERWCGWHCRKRIFGGKTTEYVFYLDLIDSFYPRVKKICIIRNPKDRVISFYFHQKRKGRLKPGEKITDNFVRNYCLDRVKKEYEIILNYRRDVHYLTYSWLSRETVEAVKGMLKYLEVNYTDKIIGRMIEEGDFKNLTRQDILAGRKARERGEEFTKSHYRKGVVGDWRSHLTPKQVAIVDDTTKDLEAKIFSKYSLSY